MLEQIKTHPLIKPLVTTIGAATLSTAMGCGGPSRPPEVNRDDWLNAGPTVREKLAAIHEQNEAAENNPELQKKLTQLRISILMKEAEERKEMELDREKHSQALRSAFYEFDQALMKISPGQYHPELEEQTRIAKIDIYSIVFGDNSSLYLVENNHGRDIYAVSRVLVSDDVVEVALALHSLHTTGQVPEDFNGDVIPSVRVNENITFGLKKLKAGLIVSESKERFFYENERNYGVDLRTIDGGEFLARVQYRGVDKEGNDRYLFILKGQDGKYPGWDPIIDSYRYASNLDEAVAIVNDLEKLTSLEYSDAELKFALQAGEPVEAQGEVSHESSDSDFEF